MKRVPKIKTASGKRAKAARVRHRERYRDPAPLHGPVKVVSPATIDETRYAPHDLRMAVLERDRYRCRHCGVPVTNETANMDHVIPWENGGKTVKTNLVTACRDCNKAKGNSYWFPNGKRRPAKYRYPKRSSEPAASTSGVDGCADA